MGVSDKEINQRTLTAVVSCDKNTKSRSVLVESLKKHPIYGKYIKTRTKMMVHDEENKSKLGDKVVIQESRPISKKKRWTVIEVKGKGE
jgi:small subunit ribosomal protein S17